MPLVVKDRVKQFSVTAGTGTLTLGATPNGFQSFAVVGDTNTTFYAIVDGGTGDWEVGVGTYTASGTTLSRDSVLSSSNSDNLVNFGSASKEVFAVYTADKAVFTDVVQTLTNKTINGANNTITNVSLTTGVTGTLPIANGGTGQTTAGAAINALLPAQSSQSGKFLTTDGTNLAWSFVPDPIPSGTKTVFVQTNAPTGWTKDTTHDNKALRVVSGTAASGGSVAFTTAFASQAISGSISSTTATNQNTTADGTVGSTTATNQNTTAGGTVGNHTLTTAQIPSHTHNYLRQAVSNWAGGGNNARLAFEQNTATGGTGGGGAHSHTFTGNAHTHTQDAHTHTFTGNAHTHTQDAHTHTFTGTAVNLAVQYVDVIIATKD